MRLEWLEDIIAVAETGSFSEAAERRHLTQSAFSRRIQNIEDYVGVRLFDRTRKPVHLRPTTEDQRDEIVRLASALRQLVENLRHGDRRSLNRIVIVSQHALTAAYTPALIRALQAHRQDIFVRLRSANLDDCFSQLLARQVDIAIVYRVPGQEHPIEADYIETAVIGVDRLIPVCATRDITGLRARLAAGEVPVIAYPPEVFLGDVLERFVFPKLPANLKTIRQVETALTLAALEMALVELGVAWVPESLCHRHAATGQLTELTGDLPACDLLITAVRLSGASGPAERDVWSLLGRQDAAVAG
ncbi:MAG: LysR family transcriptional regulator [Rhodobacteraceae bacterium]|nr:LysR family transcriptional regulator [Paracoccaceae bacterium]